MAKKIKSLLSRLLPNKDARSKIFRTDSQDGEYINTLKTLKKERENS